MRSSNIRASWMWGETPDLHTWLSPFFFFLFLLFLLKRFGSARIRSFYVTDLVFSWCFHGICSSAGLKGSLEGPFSLQTFLMFLDKSCLLLFSWVKFKRYFCFPQRRSEARSFRPSNQNWPRSKATSRLCWADWSRSQRTPSPPPQVKRLSASFHPETSRTCRSSSCPGSQVAPDPFFLFEPKPADAEEASFKTRFPLFKRNFLTS